MSGTENQVGVSEQSSEQIAKQLKNDHTLDKHKFTNCHKMLDRLLDKGDNEEVIGSCEKEIE